MIPGAPAPQPAAAGMPAPAPHPAQQPPSPAQMGPSSAPSAPAAPPQPAPPPPPMQTVFDADKFGAALQLLKDQRHRGFRIDIETDSTVLADAQTEQQASAQMLQAVGAFLQSALPLAQAMPQVMPLLGKMLLYMVRRFKVGVDLEAAMEDAIEKLEGGGPAAQMQNPKAQETQAKQNLDLQKAQLDAHQSQQAHAMDLQAKGVALQADMVKAKAEMVRATVDEQKAEADHQRTLQEMHTAAALGVGQGQPLMPQHLQFGAGTMTGSGQ